MSEQLRFKRIKRDFESEMTDESYPQKWRFGRYSTIGTIVAGFKLQPY